MLGRLGRRQRNSSYGEVIPILLYLGPDRVARVGSLWAGMWPASSAFAHPPWWILTLPFLGPNAGGSFGRPLMFSCLRLPQSGADQLVGVHPSMIFPYPPWMHESYFTEPSLPSRLLTLSLKRNPTMHLHFDPSRITDLKLGPPSSTEYVGSDGGSSLCQFLIRCIA